MKSLVISEQFAAQAALTPEATAVSTGSTRLTYRELDDRANRLAHRLIRLGVGREDRVAVLLERSIDLVVAVLAILKAGAAYVPVHEDYPPDRRQWVVDDVAASVLLTDTSMRAGGLPGGVTVVVVDDDPLTGEQPASDPTVPIHPDQLAYVIHTSGSTGHPKGVAVTQRDVVRLIFNPDWAPQRHARLLMVAPHAFDVSAFELWMPLLHGGEVVVAPAGHPEPAMLRRLIGEARITGLHLTAGLFRMIAEEAPETFIGSSEILTGGDVISPSAVRRVLDSCPEVVIRAMYGTTETSVFSAHHLLDASYRPGMLVPVGAAFSDMRIEILDDRLTPVPNGIEGEVYICGNGVARGYFGRPDLTAEAFVADPFGAPGGRMYRTGDLARRNDAGLIEFVGRANSQVKILGFRVELAEVEAALADYPGLAHVVVVVRDLESGEKRLIGYVVPEAGDIDVGALRAHARKTLPDYMVPAAFVQLQSLPLTANGKLDREAMPAPDLEAGTTYRAPQTPLQEALCAIFGSVLEVERVGIDDSFFDLGGQSLQAMRLLSRIRAEFDVDLLINVLFDVPTVVGLAEHVADAVAAA